MARNRRKQELLLMMELLTKFTYKLQKILLAYLIPKSGIPSSPPKVYSCLKTEMQEQDRKLGLLSYSVNTFSQQFNCLLYAFLIFPTFIIFMKLPTTVASRV